MKMDHFSKEVSKVAHPKQVTGTDTHFANH